MLGVFAKLFKSIVSTDLFILFFAFGETIVFILALGMAKGVFVKYRKDKGDSAKAMRSSNRALIVFYSLFEACISIFPLLGMFGTVAALLGLDLTAGDMTNIRNNFFMALTSTAWGIIFSVIFKIVHAVTADYFDEKIKESAKLAEECNKIFEEER